MSVIKEKLHIIKKNIQDPSGLVFKICNYDHYQFAPLFSDKLYIKAYYKRFMGKKLTSKQLRNPKTFNEKLNWLKLNDRKPLYTSMADKIEGKKFIAEKVGIEYVIPTIGVYDSVDKIPFDDLPDQYVIKCNHDSGSVYICQSKSTFDIEKVKNELRKKLKRNAYWASREWQYKNIKPRIIIEELLLDEKGNPPSDIKFFCFNGTVYYIEMVIDRFNNHKDIYLTREFESAGFGEISFNSTEPSLIEKPKDLQKPKKYNEMINIAERLSHDIPVLRVDMYYANNQVYVGEMTFRPNGGVRPLSGNGDEIMGELLVLPKKSRR